LTVQTKREIVLVNLLAMQIALSASHSDWFATERQIAPMLRMKDLVQDAIVKTPSFVKKQIFAFQKAGTVITKKIVPQALMKDQMPDALVITNVKEQTLAFLKAGFATTKQIVQEVMMNVNASVRPRVQMARAFLTTGYVTDGTIVGITGMSDQKTALATTVKADAP
jgi:hypothetical protein